MTIYQSTTYRIRQLFSILAVATASNPVLLEGEKWLEKDATTLRATGRSKTGDGILSADKATITGTAFNDLPFDPGASSDAIRIDASEVNTIYSGRAAVGTAESSTGWTIKRRTFSAAGVLLTTTTATGAWSNRVSLTYS